MKKRRFFEPFTMYGGFFLFGIFAPCFYICLSVWANYDDAPVYVSVYFAIMAVLAAVFFSWYAGSRQDCLTVTEDGVIWRCLFRRTRRIVYDDCRYIGVETFNKEARCPVVRGDECAAVYLSMDPFPEKFKGRINHLRCTDRIIKFYYTDALAETILAVAPEEKTYLLRAFYNQMQNYDRQQERAKRKRRNRRKKS